MHFAYYKVMLKTKTHVYFFISFFFIFEMKCEI